MKRPLTFVLAASLALGGCTQLQTFKSSPATRQLAQQADAGDSESQYRLGVHFTTGADVEQNYAQGLNYFRKAALAGHTDAQYMLGMGHYLGRGTAQDYSEARKWLELAADRQHREAMHYLGEIYFNGYGTEAEPAWGIHWIGQAAEMGYSEAQYLLGTSYLTGIGSIRNTREGVRWLGIAANGGSLRAKALLDKLGRRPDNSHFTPPPAATDELKERYRIRYAQTRLHSLGYPTGSADGIWGQQTASASRRFMKRSASLDDLIKALRKQPERR